MLKSKTRRQQDLALSKFKTGRVSLMVIEKERLPRAYSGKYENGNLESDERE